MGRFVPNPAAAQEIMAEIGPRWVDYAGQAATEAVSAAAPLQTGFLKQRIYYRQIAGPSGEPAFRVIADTDYATFVNVGTGLYGPLHQYITPNRARVLSWIQNGERVFAKRVAGQPGNPFVIIGLRAVFGDNVRERVDYAAAPL